ncbi:hypothetical protein Ahy_B09g095257 [Arachis hypogaea]|uniref:Zinc knuckle CX2CX4HX4C domain-containing protein n=1 Tax=Arachis hypogaea TaxID=3818 RepID=A0A444XDA8_ARAHY|nr:hypothetical protein Ahy_B09g095257 [Arachis hypogaea]
MEAATSEPIKEHVQTTEVEEEIEEYIEYEEKDVKKGVQKCKHNVVDSDMKHARALQNKTLRRKIVNIRGRVKECNLYSAGPGKGSFIKENIQMNLAEPVRKGIHMGSKEDEQTWVDFRFERLPTFCYYCGLIGHDEVSCEKHEAEEDGGRAKSNELGTWLRADNRNKNGAARTTKANGRKRTSSWSKRNKTS